MVEKKLIKGLQKGDPKAFKQIFDDYSSVLMGMAWRYASNEADAEDILQDAFIKIYQKVGDYKGSGSFEGWMKRVLVSTAINFLNKRSKEQARQEEKEIGELEIPDENIPNDLGEKELLSALKSLPEGYRIVFNLNVIEGYEHKEIAEMTGISPGTSQSQLFKAKKMLRNKLKAEEVNSKRMIHHDEKT